MMNINGLMGMFNGFMQNPVAFMAQRQLNIPQEYMKDPNSAIQYLMNTGKVNQQMYDNAVKQANEIQKNYK